MQDSGFVVTSPQLRGARIDESASRLDWRPADFLDDMDPMTGDFVVKSVQQKLHETRSDIAQGMSAALGGGGSKPARFRVTVLRLGYLYPPTRFGMA
jgi:hypothetical protein